MSFGERPKGEEISLSLSLDHPGLREARQQERDEELALSEAVQFGDEAFSSGALRGLNRVLYKFDNAPREQRKLSEEHAKVLARGIQEASGIPLEELYAAADANGDKSIRQLRIEPARLLAELAKTDFVETDQNRYDFENTRRLLRAVARVMDER